METNKEKVEEFKKEVIDMKEFELFLTIESLGSVRFREKHEFFNGRLKMSEADFNKNQEYYHALQQECLFMLKKFDVDYESVNDKPNGNYWKWYKFWKEWMDSFSDQGWKNFTIKFQQKENVEDLLPKKKWNE